MNQEIFDSIISELAIENANLRIERIVLRQKNEKLKKELDESNVEELIEKKRD